MPLVPKYLNMVGLGLDFLGAFVLTLNLIISEKEAIRLELPRWAWRTDEENLKLPQVQDRLKQSRHAVIGMGLLVLGFLFQLAASWLQR
jgi:hypothetical protein